ncbi:hemoglobin beta embryonic-2 [Silurus meridionalis]|nr:hemoglobin beta embryonic-2 [Silurus meridionalis]
MKMLNTFQQANAKSPTDQLLADCITIVVGATLGSSFTAEVQAALHKFLAVIVSALVQQYH